MHSAGYMFKVRQQMWLAIYATVLSLIQWGYGDRTTIIRILVLMIVRPYYGRIIVSSKCFLSVDIQPRI